MTSAGVAHAHPSFVIAEQQARAGDVVHFSITGADGHVTYELEVGDRDVLEGAGAGATVSGEFTMPDLGGSAKTVKVEAEMRDSDHKTKVKRKLEYLGRAVAVIVTPTPLPPVAAPALPQAASDPQPTPSSTPTPAAAAVPASPAPAVTHRSKGKPSRHARNRRKVKRQREASRRSRKHKRETPVTRVKTKTRAGRPTARTAPLFDGVPEPGSEHYSAREDNGSKARHATPPAAVLATAVGNRHGAGDATAILVPGLLGMAGFILAGAALLRRRRTR